MLARGDWQDDSGELVQPAIPEYWGKLTGSGERLTRLDLANWLVNTEEGVGLLTARVMVNRLWALLFGQGIADLNDFGGQGKPPTHPELLDRLAWEFVESGWDVKHMLRLMAVSRTYRQQSLTTPDNETIDPGNLLYSRQQRFRLPAEMIRDNLLAVSGLLVNDYGGGSAHPYQPAGYYRHLNFPKREYVSDTDNNQWRRGVYVHWQRQFLHPMLKAFDAPSREECTAERPRSNTPLAALTLLNDPSLVEPARGFATRILREGGKTPSERIAFAFREAISRLPEELEEQILLETLEFHQSKYQQDPAAAELLLKIGLAPVPEKMNATELASWTQVARVLFNLSEMTTRN